MSNSIHAQNIFLFYFQYERHFHVLLFFPDGEMLISYKMIHHKKASYRNAEN
jgi:hypothetical protein